MRDSPQGVRLLVWGVTMATVFGAMIGALLSWRGWPLLLGFALGFAVALVAIVGCGYAISASAERGARAVLAPTGSSVPYQREYSHIQALEAQGHYARALIEYERIAAESPPDAELCLRIGRLLRDRLGHWEEAARWLRKAREGRDVAAHADVHLARELVELYRRAGTPQRAATELARIAAVYPGTASARWARIELDELRKEIHEDNGSSDGAPKDAPSR